MLKVLEKIESKVICVIDDKSFHYVNGKEAYKELSSRYSIASIKAFNNQMNINLILKEDNKEQDWQADYKKQFGEEARCFY